MRFSPDAQMWFVNKIFCGGSVVRLIVLFPILPILNTVNITTSPPTPLLIKERGERVRFG